MKQLVAAMLALAASAAAAEEPWDGRRAAFFGVTFIDTSTEGDLMGVRADETARTAMLTDTIAEALEAEGIELVDLAPVRDVLDRTKNPAKCNGCDIRMARELGADYSIVSEVQKVSNLILSMNIYVRDTGTGGQVAGQAVDIRGNTDESWTRGARYILKNSIFTERADQGVTTSR
jgi:Protein of unknown function (DUF2380)